MVTCRGAWLWAGLVALQFPLSKAHIWPPGAFSRPGENDSTGEGRFEVSIGSVMKIHPWFAGSPAVLIGPPPTHGLARLTSTEWFLAALSTSVYVGRSAESRIATLTASFT